jgi:HlyD family secretion protein
MFDRTCECPGDLIFPSTSGFADPSCRPPDNVDRIKLGGAVRGQIASNCGGRKLGLGLAGFKTTSDYRAETFAHLNLDPVPLGIGDLVHAHVEIDCAHAAVSAFFLNDSHRWNCSGVCNYDDRAGCDSGSELMRIVPRNAALEVEAYPPNHDIGFVAAGQPAVIKVEAFPFTRYGTPRLL